MWLKTCMFSSNGFKKILQNVEVLRIKVFRVTKSLGRGQIKILNVWWVAKCKLGRSIFSDIGSLFDPPDFTSWV